MTDHEYRVKRLLRAVADGDQEELALLADEAGVVPLSVRSEYSDAMDQLYGQVLSGFGVPAHLLRTP